MIFPTYTNHGDYLSLLNVKNGVLRSHYVSSNWLTKRFLLKCSFLAKYLRILRTKNCTFKRNIYFKLQGGLGVKGRGKSVKTQTFGQTLTNNVAEISRQSKTIFILRTIRPEPLTKH